MECKVNKLVNLQLKKSKSKNEPYFPQNIWWKELLTKHFEKHCFAKLYYFTHDHKDSKIQLYLNNL